jgi:hypothetical protein
MATITVIPAYTATYNFTSDIDECEFEDFLEFMMEETAQDDSELVWNQEAHTIKISISCLHAICKHLKRWPLKEAIGPHTYGDMASLFKMWLDANKGGDTVVIKFGDAFED